MGHPDRPQHCRGGAVVPGSLSPLIGGRRRGGRHDWRRPRDTVADAQPGAVLDQLTAASGPLSAYAWLTSCRSRSPRAAQVYRALEKLVALGLVHRLESLNAFVVCQQPGCAPHTAVIFTICVTCGAVADPGRTGRRSNPRRRRRLRGRTLGGRTAWTLPTSPDGDR